MVATWAQIDCANTRKMSQSVAQKLRAQRARPYIAVSVCSPDQHARLTDCTITNDDAFDILGLHCHPNVLISPAIVLAR